LFGYAILSVWWWYFGSFTDISWVNDPKYFNLSKVNIRNTQKIFLVMPSCLFGGGIPARSPTFHG
jgi:hypothetical protein